MNNITQSAIGLASLNMEAYELKRKSMKHYQLGKSVAKMQVAAKQYLLQVQAKRSVFSYATHLVERAKEVDKEFTSSSEVNMDETKEKLMTVLEMIVEDALEHGQRELQKSQ